ncbi:MAG: hypothetical protein ABL986_23380 [Vicinamibacterales bacterium]
MPSDRRWLSGAIAFHLVAITIAALPMPSELAVIEPSSPPPSSMLAPALAPLFDRLALVVAGVEPVLYRASAPLRILTQPYINAGLKQKWNMFANPGHDDSYMRVDYLVATDGSGRPTQRVQELVFPAAREDRPRWRHEFRDKAIFSSVENYFVRFESEEDVNASATAPDMVPIARYFGRTFRQTLPQGQQLVRVEVWYGVAPIPAPGEPIDSAAEANRLQALVKYRAPLTPRPTSSVSLERPGSRVTEGDITWTLFYRGEV